jgi:hypothetical protein
MAWIKRALRKMCRLNKKLDPNVETGSLPVCYTMLYFKHSLWTWFLDQPTPTSWYQASCPTLNISQVGRKYIQQSWQRCWQWSKVYEEGHHRRNYCHMQSPRQEMIGAGEITTLDHLLLQSGPKDTSTRWSSVVYCCWKSWTSANATRPSSQCSLHPVLIHDWRYSRMQNLMSWSNFLLTVATSCQQGAVGPGNQLKGTLLMPGLFVCLGQHS